MKELRFTSLTDKLQKNRKIFSYFLKISYQYSVLVVSDWQNRNIFSYFLKISAKQKNMRKTEKYSVIF